MEQVTQKPRMRSCGSGDKNKHPPCPSLTLAPPADVRFRSVSVVNFSRPINVYAPPRSMSQGPPAAAGAAAGRSLGAQKDQGNGHSTKIAANPPAHHGRSYPAKAVMQWEYKVARFWFDALTAQMKYRRVDACSVWCRRHETTSFR